MQLNTSLENLIFSSIEPKCQYNPFQSKPAVKVSIVAMGPFVVRKGLNCLITWYVFIVSDYI